MPTASGYPVPEEIVPVADALLRGLVSIWRPDTAALLTRSMVRAKRGAPDRFPDVGAVRAQLVEARRLVPAPPVQDDLPEVPDVVAHAPA